MTTLVINCIVALQGVSSYLMQKQFIAHARTAGIIIPKPSILMVSLNER